MPLERSRLCGKTDTPRYVPKLRSRVVERGSWDSGTWALHFPCLKAEIPSCVRARDPLFDVQISLWREAERTKPVANLQAQSCQAHSQPVGHSTVAAIGEAPGAKTKSRVGGIFEIRAVNDSGCPKAIAPSDYESLQAA